MGRSSDSLLETFDNYYTHALYYFSEGTPTEIAIDYYSPSFPRRIWRVAKRSWFIFAYSSTPGITDGSVLPILS
jgi:hypothetical protein